MRFQTRSTELLRLKPLALAGPLFCLAACSGSGAEAPGPADENEAEALSKAAEMLEDPRTQGRGSDDAVGPDETPSEGETREGL